MHSTQLLHPTAFYKLTAYSKHFELQLNYRATYNYRRRTFQLYEM